MSIWRPSLMGQVSKSLGKSGPGGVGFLRSRVSLVLDPKVDETAGRTANVGLIDCCSPDGSLELRLQQPPVREAS